MELEIEPANEEEDDEGEEKFEFAEEPEKACKSIGDCT